MGGHHPPLRGEAGVASGTKEETRLDLNVPPRLIPLWVKLLYSAFVAVLIPHYLRAYGPTNFLYFCDVALLLTLVAVWVESALIVSAAAVGILLPQLLWMIDFLSSALGVTVTGMTGYMFNDALPLFARFLSFFHFWLPLFLLWLIARLGYDRRAPWLWWPLASALVLISYTFLPPPPPPADNPGLPVNVNYVYGLGDDRPQTWMHPVAWLACVLTALPLVVYWPTHLLLRRVFPAPRT
jgi:hypothetical protein